MQITSKLPNVGTTIFTIMSGLASEYNAVNLGQGFPDYQMNEELMALVNEAMSKGYNQYAPHARLDAIKGIDSGKNSVPV